MCVYLFIVLLLLFTVSRLILLLLLRNALDLRNHACGSRAGFGLGTLCLHTPLDAHFNPACGPNLCPWGTFDQLVYALTVAVDINTAVSVTAGLSVKLWPFLLLQLI